MPLQSAQTIQRDALRLVVFLVFLCMPFVPSRTSADSESQPRTTITFAQLSDAHIFDDGWNLPTADALRQAADDRVALRWAIERINHLVASGVSIDFVVYTGDFGLQNVDFPADGACKPLKPKIEPGLPMVPLRWAVNEVATELDQLVVRKIFVLAGNNDIVDENVLDTRRFDCFLSELQMVSHGYSLPLQISALNADSLVTINGIHLAGLNTASFKKLLNYDQACSNPPAPTDAAMLREACPASQMTLLRQFNAARPMVLFTHVPDLKDPYRKSELWVIQPKVRQLWEKEICGPSVAAVFAAHFHDADRTIYATTTGTRDLVVSECVAGRTWVTPPLAAKNQVGKIPQARGFLLATVAATGVLQAQPIWYEPPTSTLAQKHPGLGIALALTSVLIGIGSLVFVASRKLNPLVHNVIWPAVAGSILWTFLQVAVDPNITGPRLPRLIALAFIAVYLAIDWVITNQIQGEDTIKDNYWWYDMPLAALLATFAVATQFGVRWAAWPLAAAFAVAIVGHFCGAWDLKTTPSSPKARATRAGCNALGIALLGIGMFLEEPYALWLTPIAVISVILSFLHFLKKI